MPSRCGEPYGAVWRLHRYRSPEATIPQFAAPEGPVEWSFPSFRTSPSIIWIYAPGRAKFRTQKYPGAGCRLAFHSRLLQSTDLSSKNHSSFTAKLLRYFKKTIHRISTALPVPVVTLRRSG